MLQTELSDVYLAAIEGRLAELKDGSGVLISAVLGNWTQGTGYVFRRREKRHFRSRWFLAPSFSLAPRDDAGAKDLENRRNRAIGECTNALGQSAEHIGNFFALLGRELAFYVGCLNLSETLAARSLPFSLPGISEAPGNRSWEGLYDTGLALTKEGTIVGNTFSAKDTRLYIITGANQGGKTTFLRSIGQAQLMLQCGMIVGAKHFSGPIRCGLFTHFKKEEDTAMTSGKFEEELSRMHGIAERLSPGALVLFNESFSATNEREGSEICRQITEALIDSGIEVFSVTHLSPYAHSFSKRDGVQFLRAQRLASGDRTFRIVSGEPLPTAFGQDIWNKYMGKEEKLSEKGQAAEEKPPESQSFSLKEQT
jgi:DNA mismatch repair ATPase MutS